ncbi:hypothetical protein SAMN05421787_10588 [Virgibacillus pantothenticus]|nr:hypothetical protein SAMN05421787_10588 [Virgibacillus pantothenticus]
MLYSNISVTYIVTSNMGVLRYHDPREPHTCNYLKLKQAVDR